MKRHYLVHERRDPAGHMHYTAACRAELRYVELTAKLTEVNCERCQSTAAFKTATDEAVAAEVRDGV